WKLEIPKSQNENPTDAELRDDRTASLDALGGPNHALRRKIVVLAHILEQLCAGTPFQNEAARPHRGVGAGIINRDFILKRIEIGPRKALDEMQLVRCRF